MMNASNVKTSGDIYRLRMERISELKRLGGRLGLVNPALAQELLGVCRQRIYQLISQGRIESFGLNGFRLVPLRSVIEFAKASGRQKGRKVKSRNARQLSGRFPSLGVA